MPRPISLFTGPWTDLPLEDVARKASEWGYHGLELACWGEHFDVERAVAEEGYCAQRRDLFERYDLEVCALNSGAVGQAVLGEADERLRTALPAAVWGDGSADKVQARAVEELKKTARAAQQLGVGLVTGASGSSIWRYALAHPPASEAVIDAGYAHFAEQFNPILDTFAECGVQFALAIRPGEIAFDPVTTSCTLAAIERREELGLLVDVAELAWQGVDPAEYLRAFAERIYHLRLNDMAVKLTGRSSILCGQLPSGDARRGWDYRSIGRGSVDFEELVRTLNQISYTGPLAIACQDPQMDRDASAQESCQFVQNLDFPTRTTPIAAKAGRT